MSNITLFGGQQLPAHLTNIADDTDQFGGGTFLPTLSIRGKEFRFRMAGQEQATGLREIECIIVRRRERTSRRFFKDKYVPGSVAQPTCHSVDSITPDRWTEKQSETCQQCPHSVWGSKISDNGQPGFACENYKLLAIVPLVEGSWAESAVALHLPPSSLKRKRGEQSQLMHAQEYFEALKSHNVPAIGAVTRLRFTSAEFPQIAFEFVRFASPDEVAFAMALRDSEEVVAAIDGTAVETTAPVEPPVAPARPQVVAVQPAPVPSTPVPTPVAAPVAVPASVPAAPVAPAKPRGRPRVQAVPSAPAPAPAPAPQPQVIAAGEQPVDSSGTMSQVRSLLARLNGGKSPTP